jgi:hypothetical protein
LLHAQQLWDSSTMGLDDPAVFVDRLVELRCPRGHALRSFQAPDLDGPSTRTYVVHEDRLYLAQAADGRSLLDAAPEVWRIEADGVVREHRFTLREVRGPLSVRLYATCRACEAELARTAPPGASPDAVHERGVAVRFQLTFRPGEPIQIERVPPDG